VLVTTRFDHDCPIHPSTHQTSRYLWNLLYYCIWHILAQYRKSCQSYIMKPSVFPLYSPSSDRNTNRFATLHFYANLQNHTRSKAVFETSNLFQPIIYPSTQDVFLPTLIPLSSRLSLSLPLPRQHRILILFPSTVPSP
jgi:hypothetical protein